MHNCAVWWQFCQNQKVKVLPKPEEMADTSYHWSQISTNDIFKRHITIKFTFGIKTLFSAHFVASLAEPLLVFCCFSKSEKKINDKKKHYTIIRALGMLPQLRLNVFAFLVFWDLP